jgi:hypothetical protein
MAFSASTRVPGQAGTAQLSPAHYVWNSLRDRPEARDDPQLATLFDEVYESGLAELQEQVEREGEDSIVGSEFCLIEVLAVRG